MTRTRLFSISISVLLLAVLLQAEAQKRELKFSLPRHSLAAAIDSLSRWYGVPIIYLDRDVEDVVISASSPGCTFEQALQLVLQNTPLEAYASGSQVILRQKRIEPVRVTGTISGIVSDSLTGNSLGGVNVVLREQAGEEAGTAIRWCPTNTFGFFCLRRVPPGAYVMEIRSVGYHTANVPVTIGGPDPVTREVALVQESIPLEEVTVEGQRMTDGTAGGMTRGLFVRSSPTDQNEYLLDGARIYNPAHYGGVLSSFHPEVLNEIEISQSGLPPSYGGRIGGILDLSLRDGTRERFSGIAGTGFLGSHLAIEGPIGGNTTYLLSGRRAYPDVLVPGLDEHGMPSRLGSTEFIAKVSHRIAGDSRLSFSGYAGRDRYTNSAAANGAILSNAFSWANTTANLRWMTVVSPSVFLHASAVYTRYSLNLDHVSSGILGLAASGPLNSHYRIEDASLRAHAEHYYDEHHTLLGGVEVVRHGINGMLSSFDTQLAPLSLQSQAAWDLSVYIQDRWAITPRLEAEVGARATTFTGPAESFSAVDPRFSLLFTPSDGTRIYATATSVNQFLHPYRSSGVFQYYPALFWYPSTDAVSPTTSLQFTIGGSQGIGKGDVALSAEGFYRTVTHLHDVQWEDSPLDTGGLYSRMVTGSGKSYGLDLSLRKRTGSFTGTLSYTLSWTDQTFAELNGGVAFSPLFDRRHIIHAAAAYMPDETWIFSILAVLAAGGTDANQFIQSHSIPPEMDNAGVRGSYASYSGIIDVNGGRFPGFQRLELQVMHRFALAGVRGEVSLQLINGYGLLDPMAIELRPDNGDRIVFDQRLVWRARVKEIPLFPLFPVAGVTVRF